MGRDRLMLAPLRWIGAGAPTYVVAEAGQNHNGSVEVAEQLVDAAAWSGADAVKFVKRDLDCELALEAWRKPYDSPHSFGATYGEHRAALELSADDHARLAQRARAHGIDYFATACDAPSLDLLLSLEAPLVKIASRDLGNLPLVEYVGRCGKPVLLSTGMSDLPEIDRAVGMLRRCRARYLVMQCTSLYPAPLDQAHLRSLPTLAARYRVPVGFSDHTRGALLAPVAVGMGAAVIEKHLTLRRDQKGTDHACSLEPSEFAEMVRRIRQVEQALGSPEKPVPDAVTEVRSKLGRSLVTKAPLAAGQVLDEAMLALKCPGDGLAWNERARILGRPLRRAVDANEKLSLTDFL